MPRLHPVTVRIRRALGALLIGVALLICAGVVAVAWTELPPRLRARDSQVIEYRDHSLAHVFLSEDQKWRIAVTPEEIDPAYLRALVCLEDRRFYVHSGVDGAAVLRALATNVGRRRIVSGASTLTMQLARMLVPRPRSFSAKLRQALLAIKLEQRLSKAEILAAYLRFLPFGHNVEGVEAAALSYFGHRASALSPAEIATLLAVPQDPTHRFPSAAHTRALQGARDRVAERLLGCDALPLGQGSGRLTGAQVLRQIHDTPVPDALQPFPRAAMHASMWLQQGHAGQARLLTTLDRGVQRNVERIVQAAQAEMARKGIHNTAVIVVERSATGTAADVRAVVGGFDYWAGEAGAQVPAFAALRSPGSALKPFLFAMAIDRGQALPDFLVPDVPLEFGSYTPQNFEKDHAVLVRLSDALSRSLNLPFVHLLNQVGVDRFTALLRTLGVRSLRSEPGYYGLSAAVGAVEVTPLEVASLYAALAHDGHPMPLRFLGSEPLPAGRGPAAFSGEAASLTRQVLSRRDRPDFPDRAKFSGQASGIHWKTGTSFGHRDAWAAGSSDRYTAVVWLGNLDSRPSSALVGGPAAGPILFDVLESTRSPAAVSGDAPPDGLKPIAVCAYSGYPPGPACPEQRQVLAPVRSVPTMTCPYHMQFEVDASSGMAVTPACRARHRSELRSFVIWPAHVRRFLDRKSVDGRAGAPPQYAPGCWTGDQAAPPQITAPPLNQSILLLPGRPAQMQQVPLSADSSHSAHLSWFVDGEFLGTYPTQERVYWVPKSGDHVIVVTDGAGGSARRTLRVRALN